MVNALVFDFDGVIIDTEKACYDSWQIVFAEYDKVLPLNEWVKNIGRAVKVADPHKILQELTGEQIDSEELFRKARTIELGFANQLQPLPGVIALLEKAKRLNIPCAVASSSSRNWVDGHLKRLSIDHFFTTLVCREDTSKHKPEPEPYQTAVARLGATPTNSIAIEDAPMGILSATTAGLRCVAVGCSLTNNLDLSRATWRFKTLLEFDIDSLL